MNSAAELVDVAVRVGLAFLLALPVGWARERRSGPAGGLRAFPLVSVGACGSLLLGQRVMQSAGAQADVLYGVLTGIGFVGLGAMATAHDNATGLSAAVALWVAAAVGAAVAFGSLPIAAALSLLSALVAGVRLSPAERAQAP